MTHRTFHNKKRKCRGEERKIVVYNTEMMVGEQGKGKEARKKNVSFFVLGKETMTCTRGKTKEFPCAKSR
jgi:hypothetical protein